MTTPSATIDDDHPLDRIEQFHIGLEFQTGAGRWRCTDVGTRTVVAIAIDTVAVTHLDAEHRASQSILSVADATQHGWFDGPPYAVGEHVFPIEEGGMWLP